MKKMNKKLLSLLMVFAMVLTCAPAVSAAESTGHDHTRYNYKDLENGTHKVICADCGEVVTEEAACVWENGNPCICGSTESTEPEKPACDHMNNKWTYKDNKNGTHDVICADCGDTVTTDVACVWENGNPCICGSTESTEPEKPACDHMNNKWTYKDNKNGTHDVICEDCGETVTKDAACVWEDGKDCVCGSKKPACDHMNNKWTYKDNKNGTHDVICEDCGETVTKDAACVWEDGKACVCGSEKPACDHMNNKWTYKDNKNGTHDVICEDCGETVTKDAACVWEDGKACVCGSEEPACDHMGNHWIYTDNGDGTHKVTCADCEEVVTEKATCVWEDGKACVCGSEEPACDHMGNHWIYTDNGDGTHKVTCKDCGEVVTEKAACVWEDGHACVCGSEKPAEQVPSVPVKPAKPHFNFFEAIQKIFESIWKGCPKYYR